MARGGGCAREAAGGVPRTSVGVGVQVRDRDVSLGRLDLRRHRANKVEEVAHGDGARIVRVGGDDAAVDLGFPLLDLAILRAWGAGARSSILFKAKPRMASESRGCELEGR